MRQQDMITMLSRVTDTISEDVLPFKMYQSLMERQVAMRKFEQHSNNIFKS